MAKSKKRKSNPDDIKENEQSKKEIPSKKENATPKPKTKKKKDPLAHIHNPLEITVDFTDPIGDMPILGITTNIDKKCICIYYENGTFIFLNKVFKVMSSLRSNYKTICALLLNSHLIICTRKRKVVSYSFLNQSYTCIGETEDQIVGIFTVKIGYDGFIVVDKKGTIYFFQPINHHWKLDTTKHLKLDISYIVVENNIMYWWSVKKGIFSYNILTNDLVFILQEFRSVSYIKPVILDSEDHLLISFYSGLSCLISLAKKEYRLVTDISSYKIRSACLCNVFSKGSFLIQITSNKKKLSRKERNELLKANQTIEADGQTEQSGQPTGQSEPSSSSVQPSEQSVQPSSSSVQPSEQSVQSTSSSVQSSEQSVQSTSSTSPTSSSVQPSEQSVQPSSSSVQSTSPTSPTSSSVQSTSPTSPTSQPTSIQLKESSKQDPSKQVTDEMHTQISFFTFPSLDLIRCILNDCDSAQTIVDLSSVTNSCCIGVICESRQLLILRFRFYFY